MVLLLTRDSRCVFRLFGGFRESPSVDSPAMDTHTIVVLEGDETGQELLEEALRVLAPDVVGVALEFPRFDLSLESRRATANAVVHEAARAIVDGRARAEGGDDHARERRRRRQPEPDPARGDRSAR